ncbi:MAG: S53 family peptidase [Verrucomicrobiota bacterium]|nr:S53 family peptidase [Verrucomicrobiota bacterium]
MKIKTGTLYGAFCCLAVVVTAPASSQIVNIGGTPQPGHARPPLYLNLGPFKGPGGSRGPGGGGGGGTTSIYYNPAQIRQAYGFSPIYTTTTGANQIIAIIDAYGSPSIQKDLNTFCSYFGLPSATVDILYPQGKPGRNTGWAEETSLDVEWAHAIAPGAHIMLVVAANNSLNNLLGAVDYAVANGATVVSMSWGSGEFSGEAGYDYHFNPSSNVTFVASAGDSSEGVEWPAASPYVVGVGGTSLYLNSSTNRVSESAWPGSGGGISQYETMPAFQSGWQQFPTGNERSVPDVSYVADPNTGVEVVYGGRLYVFGGTSVGAPQWSALVALANALHSSPLSSADTALYSTAGAGSTPPRMNQYYFYDINSGSNGSDPDDVATNGYDFVTGLGSPVANTLAPALP